MKVGQKLNIIGRCENQGLLFELDLIICEITELSDVEIKHLKDNNLIVVENIYNGDRFLFNTVKKTLRTVGHYGFYADDIIVREVA